MPKCLNLPIFLLLNLVVMLALSGSAAGQRPELLYLRFNSGGGSVTNDFAQPGLPGTSVTLQGGATWNSVDQKYGG